MLSCKKSVRVLMVFLLFPFSISAYADTYTVTDFKVAGITTGDPETEVHGKIANYFSINSDELKLIEVQEKPSRNSELAPGENRKYEYGDFLVSVLLVPDYVHETDHSLVVSRVQLKPMSGLDQKSYRAFVERVRDEYTAQHGEPSSETDDGDPRLNHYYWCTAMTEHRKWPCVLKEPHVYLHQLWVSLKDDTYQNAYSRAGR